MRDELESSAVRRGRVVMGAYFVFALAVTCFHEWSIWGDKKLGEAIVPLTGWSGLGVYMWTLFFAGMSAFSPNRMSFACVIFMLGGSTVLEGLDCGRKMMGVLAGQPDFGNPYLMYDPRRPLVTVLPPVVWMAVLWLARRSLPAAPVMGQVGGAMGSD